MEATVQNLNLSKLWEYKGQVNKNNLRCGYGREEWKDENDNDKNQLYDGYFSLNCFNGIGQYNWGDVSCYEGNFYANDIHGYGCISYSDGSYFEGLFKENQRYGPGIFTYPDGSQDVGLWIENQLIRLAKNLSEVVPKLANSFDANIYLNKYKKLITIFENDKLASQIILEDIDAIYLQKFDHFFYNNLIRNTSSKFFNKEEFDKNSKISVSSAPFQEKMIEILAWNNEEALITMMEYIYKNRSDENRASFNVREVLNERETFGPSGNLEKANENFFTSIIKGSPGTSKLIVEYDLNPDVCDLYGNAGIHCAVSIDNLLALRTLLDYGANLDRYNDECLTPLQICLLRILEIKESVENWEVAFLPPLTDENAENQKYILDISCKVVRLPDKKKKEKKPKKEKPEKGKGKKGKEKVPIEVEVPEITEPDIKIQKLNLIKKTFKTLLSYGVDPNLGEVPLPPLLLSLFTEDYHIILGLLVHGADLTLTSSSQDGSLSPLHIVCSMKPNPEQPKLAHILMENGVPLNPRANENHWIEEKDKLDPSGIIKDEGKTPLHLLSMRYDFLEDDLDYLGTLFKEMVHYDCNPDLQYLGHTCLSLAVLRGNLRLIDIILSNGISDPNQKLGKDLGVPLTVLILKKYKGALPLYACEEVFNLLVQHNANPFNLVDRRNCLEFCEDENRPEVVGKKGKAKKDPHEKVVQLLYKVAQTVLDRYIMAKAVKYIFTYKIECDYTHPIFNQLVQFLDLPETKRIVQILINYGVIKLDLDKIRSLLTFVDLEKVDKMSSKPKTPKGKSKEKPPEEPLEDFLQNLSQESKIINQNLPDPEIDADSSKYRICYNCFKKNGKVLVVCPNCELVYFCSNDCNKNNLKKKTKHGCNNLFYLEELKMIEEGHFRPLILDETLKRKKLKFSSNLSKRSISIKSDDLKQSKDSSLIPKKKKEKKKI